MFSLHIGSALAVLSLGLLELYSVSHFHLASMISEDKFIVIHIVFPLQERYPFSLAALESFIFVFSFRSLITMYLDIVFFGFILFGVHSASQL